MVHSLDKLIGQWERYLTCENLSTQLTTTKHVTMDIQQWASTKIQTYYSATIDLLQEYSAYGYHHTPLSKDTFSLHILLRSHCSFLGIGKEWLLGEYKVCWAIVLDAHTQTVHSCVRQGTLCLWVSVYSISYPWSVRVRAERIFIGF